MVGKSQILEKKACLQRKIFVISDILIILEIAYIFFEKLLMCIKIGEFAAG